MYFEAVGQPIVILNDITMAQDLLEKRSALYSSRYGQCHSNTAHGDIHQRIYITFIDPHFECSICKLVFLFF
jgi:hypothetical protein